MNDKITHQLKEMNAELADLFQFLENYKEADLNKKLDPNTWSACQIMHHLIMSEDMSLKYVQKKLSFNPELKNIGLQTAWRTFLLDAYLVLPFKFKAPLAISNDNLPKTSNLPEIKAKYEIIRKDIEDFFEQIPDDLLSKEIYKHPFAGRLSLSGMLRFQAGHLKRHRKQIEKILNSI